MFPSTLQGRVVPAEFIGVVKSQKSVYLKVSMSVTNCLAMGWVGGLVVKDGESPEERVPQAQTQLNAAFRAGFVAECMV